MSIELADGRIKVSYDLGSGTVNVTSKARHNDGRWKSFTLSRILKQGILFDSNVFNLYCILIGFYNESNISHFGSKYFHT